MSANFSFRTDDNGDESMITTSCVPCINRSFVVVVFLPVECRNSFV